MWVINCPGLEGYPEHETYITSCLAPSDLPKTFPILALTPTGQIQPPTIFLN